MNHPYTIYIDGGGFIGAEILSNRGGETEKITINRRHRPHRFAGARRLLFQPYRPHSDRYPNRLAAHAEEVKKSIVRHTLEIGLRHFTRADLEAARAAGEKLHVRVLGLTSIAPDVLPAPDLATVESITVLGALHATKEIKTALADRIR